MATTADTLATDLLYASCTLQFEYAIATACRGPRAETRRDLHAPVFLPASGPRPQDVAEDFANFPAHSETIGNPS